ncbi:MAG: hypothetical protein [Olavius algarvensis Delta 4 endosymbiont]|nr:MAG: hypothetical protein [Olavius algarvensis Delta 4 endosymbiont]
MHSKSIIDPDPDSACDFDSVKGDPPCLETRFLDMPIRLKY